MIVRGRAGDSDLKRTPGEREWPDNWTLRRCEAEKGAVVETAECAAVKISAAALDQTRIRERSVDGSGGKVPDDGIFAAVFVDSKDRAVTGTTAGLSSAVKDMIWTFREGTERIRSIGAEISKMVEDDKSRAVLVEFENRAFVVRAPAQSRAVE